MSTAVEPYFQMDEVKENLDEEDQTPNEDRIQNWGNQVDRYMDNLLLPVFEQDFSKFPLTEQAWIDNDFNKNEMTKLKLLATEGTEAYFWAETNGQDKKKADWQVKATEWRDLLIQIPATTE